MTTDLLKRLCLLILVSIVVACAQIPGPAGVSKTNRSAADTWQMAGRFSAGQSIAGQDSEASEPVAGRFSWQHTPMHDELWLIGPLGNILAKVEITANGIHWQDATGRRGNVVNLRALGDRLGGLSLPELPATIWLRGQWPAEQVHQRDSNAQILLASGQGWQFDYLYGTPAPTGWPRAIEGIGPDGLWLHLVLTQWDGFDDPSTQPAP